MEKGVFSRELMKNGQPSNEGAFGSVGAVPNDSSPRLKWATIGEEIIGIFGGEGANVAANILEDERQGKAVSELIVKGKKASPSPVVTWFGINGPDGTMFDKVSGSNEPKGWLAGRRDH